MSSTLSEASSSRLDIKPGLIWLGLMMGLNCTLAWSQTSAQAPLPTAEIYTCIDANGRKLTSDRPIMACRDREQKILNPSGTVKAIVGPTLTAREASERAAKNRAEQAEQARLEEEKRQDRALLVRYPTPSTHQTEKNEALANIDHIKQAALGRVTDLLAQRTKLTDELAFYQKDPRRVPPRLQHQINQIAEDLGAQKRFVAEKDAEASRVNDRFDAEFERLTPLWRMASTQPK